jgi:hypothetical protein
VGLSPLDGWENVEFVFNFIYDLHVRVMGKRSSNSFPHQSRSVSNENSDFIHTAPKAGEYEEAKPVWECPKMAQHAGNLDLFKVSGRAAAGLGRYSSY